MAWLEDFNKCNHDDFMGDACCCCYSLARHMWLFTQTTVFTRPEIQAGSQPATAGYKETPAESQQWWCLCRGCPTMPTDTERLCYSEFNGRELFV